MTLFQLSCLLVLAIAYLVLWNSRPEALKWAPVILLTSWICEGTCIQWYGYYQYADFWWFKIYHVPLIVALIWPLVILTGREVLLAVFPRPPRNLPLWVGLIVFLDASMVEVAAVACGLWSWNDTGYLGVPLMGVLGWVIFAIVITWAMDRLKAGVTLVITPIAVHLMILISWWGALRWFGRGNWFTLYALVIIAVTTGSLLMKSRGTMPASIAAVRILAAGLFILLMLFAAPTAGKVWLHVLMLAMPYALVTWSKGRRISDG